ncbi:hypothetical protein PAXRUDRAFT_821560 [Paxillus rubicundulus Ve08.2h10]|uniref:Uncharacterized protein n=1 Tax=Paxillus rubicundulus Ve08.2h10 TaxID=930991 RepID=A0A0D0EAR1_9AGAM|nr:hypothetical protein PAXRUDRAFT_821560 [Paxillus rubicundulus Ve08.2h10]
MVRGTRRLHADSQLPLSTFSPSFAVTPEALAMIQEDAEDRNYLPQSHREYMGLMALSVIAAEIMFPSQFFHIYL